MLVQTILQEAGIPKSTQIPKSLIFVNSGVSPEEAARIFGVSRVVPYAYQIRKNGKPIGRRVQIFIPAEYENKRPIDIGSWISRMSTEITRQRRASSVERRRESRYEGLLPGANLQGRSRREILAEAGLSPSTSIPAGIRLVDEFTSNDDARDVYGGVMSGILTQYRYQIRRNRRAVGNKVNIWIPAELVDASPQVIGSWISRNSQRVQRIRQERARGERSINDPRNHEYHQFEPEVDRRTGAIRGQRDERPSYTTSTFKNWLDKTVDGERGRSRAERERNLVFKLQEFNTLMEAFKKALNQWAESQVRILRSLTARECLEWQVTLDPRMIFGRDNYVHMYEMTKEIAKIMGDFDALNFEHEVQFVHRVKSIMSQIIVQGLYPLIKEMVHKSENSISHPDIIQEQLRGSSRTAYIKIRPALKTTTNRGTWTMFNRDFLAKIKGTRNRSPLDSFLNLDPSDPASSLNRFYTAMQYDPIMRIEEYGSDSIYSAFRVLPNVSIDSDWSMTLFFIRIRDRRQSHGRRTQRNGNISDPNDVSAHLGGRYAAFKHTVKGLDLLPIQVHHSSEKFDKNIDGYPCFVYACKMSGKFTDEEIDFMLVHYIHVQEVKLIQIRNVCEKFQTCFKIYEIRNEKTNVYGSEYENQRLVEMVLFKGHYALEMRFPITMFTLRNPGVIDRYHRLDIVRESSIGNPTIGNENQYLRTRSLLPQLDKLGFLVPLDPVDENVLHQNFLKIADISQANKLDYPPSTCPAYEKKSNRSSVCHPASLFFADFEATSVDPNEIHQPYMMAVIGNPCDGDSFYRSYYNTRIQSPSFNQEWLTALSNIFIDAHDYMMEHVYPEAEPGIKRGKDAKLPPAYFIYHNLDYDQVFLQRFVGKFTASDLICCGNRVLGFTYYVGNRPIIFRDSFGYLNVALKNFPKYVPPLRELAMEKEVLPYSFFSLENVTNLIDYKWTPLHKFVATLSRNDQQHVESIARSHGWLWEGFGNDLLIDVISYTEFYCKQDCDVLRIGFMFWQQQVFEFAKIDLIEKCTISGIAYEYMIRQGVFDGCHELVGIPLYFIRKCVNGGRCMLAGNRKVDIRGVIEDFDAVSLYPSAMKRLWTVKGLPKVIPETWSLEDLRQNSNDFFVEINVKRVPKHLEFPLLPREVDGFKIYNNDPVDSLYVDNIWLEDLKTFHKIQDEDIELVRGYYYDSGRNYKIQEAIEHLFETRLSYKREKNPLETVVKMLMNSCYGKSILKPIDTVRRVVDREKLETEVMDMKAAMIEVTQIECSDNFIIRKNVAISDVRGFPALGVQVLSMSKRIMSEVMVTAQDLGIPIYYTDTDSMHINNSDGELLLLENEFRRRYNRDLIGKKMGQFHCDFDVPEFSDGHWYSSRFIGIGKKCYLDVLRNDSYPGKIDHHWRLKGVTKDSFFEKVAEFEPEESQTREEALMLHLFEGGECEFDLMAGGRCSFKNSKGLGKLTVEDFTRRVRFNERGAFYIEFTRHEREDLIE